MQAVRFRRRRPTPPAGGPTGPALCRAPYTSLHLDQHGDVRPCCQSDLVLGNVADRTITEIWTGDEARRLRSAIDEGDLSAGCDFCAWSVRTGDHRQSYARHFDHLTLPAPGGSPTQLELALSTSCNLQCTMCNGEFSSAIRIHREGRPALPPAYDDDRLAELEGLLASVEHVNLLGGEPFLSSEALRVLETLGRVAPGTEVVVTTNGTVWSDRIEALVAPLNVGFVVSVDGATKETYEAIRVGADWDVLQANIGRLADYTRTKGTSLSIAHCLMVENVHEFADLLAWAASLAMPVYVNSVTAPLESSLYHLPEPELGAAVDRLEARTAEVRRLGDPWLTTWNATLDRLRDRLVDRRRARRRTRPVDGLAPELQERLLRDGAHRLVLDIDPAGLVTALDGPARELGLRVAVGAPCRTPVDVLGEGLAGGATVDTERLDDTAHLLHITVPGGDDLIGLSQTLFDEDTPIGTRVVLTHAAGAP